MRLVAAASNALPGAPHALCGARGYTFRIALIKFAWWRFTFCAIQSNSRHPLSAFADNNRSAS